MFFSCQGRKPVFNKETRILRQSKDVWSEEDLASEITLWKLIVLSTYLQWREKNHCLSANMRQWKLIYSNEFLLLGLGKAHSINIHKWKHLNYLLHTYVKSYIKPENTSEADNSYTCHVLQLPNLFQWNSNSKTTNSCFQQIIYYINSL